MGKSQYNPFIKHYDTIREILRDFYIYGCYTRDYFSSNKASGRKYDNERRRILSYINKMHIAEKIRGHQKSISLSYDMYSCTRNFLSDSFLSKSFSRNDIRLHFYLQQLLIENASPMSLDEIVASLDALTKDLPYYNEGFDRNTVRRKLEKLVLEEVLETEKDKTKKLYKISEDFFEDFESEELMDLLYAVEFFSNTASVALPGYYAVDTLKNYIKQERNLSSFTEDIFMYKHNHLQRIIEDEIVWNLFELIESSSLACFSYIKKHRNKKANTEEYNTKIVKPLKIIIDFQYGRQYLLCVEGSKSLLSFYRIDRIKNLKAYSDEKLQEKVEKVQVEHYDKCWCASFSSKAQEDITTKVEVEFLFDEESKGYILDRLKREGKWGELEKISQNKYLFTIEVTDPEEMLPWLRSFGEHVKVKASDKHKLNEKLVDNWKELLIKYGDV